MLNSNIYFSISEKTKFVKQLEQELPYYVLRNVVKSGLTGWAQVIHPDASSVKDQHKKLLNNLCYIKERNLILDVKNNFKNYKYNIVF